MIKTYITKTSSFTMDADDTPVLGVEVPYGLIEDLDLKVNEVLKWEIDTEAKTAKISKENIIINNN